MHGHSERNERKGTRSTKVSQSRRDETSKNLNFAALDLAVRICQWEQYVKPERKKQWEAAEQVGKMQKKAYKKIKKKRGSHSWFAYCYYPKDFKSRDRQKEKRFEGHKQ